MPSRDRFTFHDGLELLRRAPWSPDRLIDNRPGAPERKSLSEASG